MKLFQKKKKFKKIDSPHQNGTSGRGNVVTKLWLSLAQVSKNHFSVTDLNTCTSGN